MVFSWFHGDLTFQSQISTHAMHLSSLLSRFLGNHVGIHNMSTKKTGGGGDRRQETGDRRQETGDRR